MFYYFFYPWKRKLSPVILYGGKKTITDVTEKREINSLSDINLVIEVHK